MQHAEVSYAVIRVNCSFTFNPSAVTLVDTFASLDDLCLHNNQFPGWWCFRLFERGLAYVGTDYLSFPLWDKYIEYEYMQQEWGRLAMIYTRILENPNQQLDRYFNRWVLHILALLRCSDNLILPSVIWILLLLNYDNTVLLLILPLDVLVVLC